MRIRRTARAVDLRILFATAVGAACGSTDLPPCSVICGAGQICPGGSSCQADGFCHAHAGEASCSGAPDLSCVTQIAAGRRGTCAVRADGALFCWGANESFQAGSAAAGPVLTPGRVTGVDHVSQVAPGGFHACALDGAGQIWCWGAAGESAVPGAAENTAVPLPVPTERALKVVSGSSFSCALHAQDVSCWGQIGDEPLTSPESLGLPAIRLAAGHHHACVVEVDASVWCWGAGGSGQLGDGLGVDQPSPVQVVDLPPASEVAAGGRFSCALDGTGGVWCWGQGGTGAGDGSPALSPLAVAVPPAAGITAGARHACAWTAGGELWCWGMSAQGQTGMASPTSLPPTRVATYGRIDEVSAGGRHTCVRADGRVECFGSNDSGQLGDGGLTSRATPAPVQGVAAAVAVDLGSMYTIAETGGALLAFGRNLEDELMIETADAVGAPLPTPALLTSPSAGDYHACALLAGQAACWGYNGTSQLGAETPILRAQPEPVTHADEVAVGVSHSCARVDGTVSCWGDNSRGQLGRGMLGTEDASPAPVIDVADAVELALGSASTCVRRATGEVACWGYGEYGQLGADTVLDSPAPLDVVGITDAISLDAGAEHVCVAHADGGVSCWGNNDFGQLGVGDLDPRLVPERLALSGAQAVGLGDKHSCAILGDGVSCWGRGEQGQLGDGAWTSSSVPVTVSGLGAVDAVSGGWWHTCAIAGGVLTCWGGNDFGQLGDDSAPAGAGPRPPLLSCPR